MSTKHRVKYGDCISSLAFTSGLLPDTIWDYPDNARLRQQRKQRNVLLPGDEVVIPDVRVKEVPAVTGERHRFVRKQVSEIFRVVVHNTKDEPLANRKYILTIDGISSSGTTTADGLVEAPIDPNAQTGKLVVGDESGDDTYEFELALGWLNPVEDITGVQQRLNNLGFDCGAVDGIPGPVTKAAIAAFQEYHDLQVTGELDAATRSILQDDHLS